jgi:hypothetical protein
MTEPNPDQVTTPERCLEYVRRVGICTWRHQPRLGGFPSLEMATPWSGSKLTNNTWFWKDDLHTERGLYFGMLLAPDIPVFVSLDLLPTLIAAQGDIDARTLYEKGHLAPNALRVYEHVEQSGPTATAMLPFPTGGRMLYLATLQQKFLLTKFDLTGRTRGTYGYRWCLCEQAFPESFDAAARLEVGESRRRIAEHLQRHGAAITPDRTARLFRWQPVP